ncbi:MAG: hypothetical protein EZS28_023900 [Streblomastix strix]|uniref:Uncharacterized protein n=1 Tax=Streblomastix strix TaxID=222440 RepID=A0A5J4VDX6_9EUKA|nr:MAG: hypothetical protein EZS28_023900 [Streblomastix strix]
MLTGDLLDGDEQSQHMNRENERPGSSQRTGNDTDPIPLFMRALLGRPSNYPAAHRLQQQLDTNNQMYEQYYKKKATDLNPTGERATKHERELLLQRKDEILGLELNKFGVHPSTVESDANVEVETSQLAVLIQRACVASSAAMIQEDPIAVQRFFLTIHHAAGIIAGDAQQRRELAIVNEQLKEALGKSGDAYCVLGKLSKDRIKEQVQINKVIQTPAIQTPVNQLTQPQINQEQTQIQVQPSNPVQFQIPNSYGSKSRYVNPKQQARAAFFSQYYGFGRGSFKRNRYGFPQFDNQQQYQYPSNSFSQQSYPSSQFQHHHMQPFQSQSALHAPQPMMFNPNVQTSQWFTHQQTFIFQQQPKFASQQGNVVPPTVPKQP